MWLHDPAISTHLATNFCRVVDPEEKAARQPGGGEADTAAEHAAGRDEGRGRLGHRARPPVPREDPRRQAELACRLDSLTGCSSSQQGWRNESRNKEKLYVDGKGGKSPFNRWRVFFGGLLESENRFVHDEEKVGSSRLQSPSM